MPSSLECNRQLELKRIRFSDAIVNKSFWELSSEEKEQLSPEVNNVQWLDLDQAVHNCLTSKSKSLTVVNTFQRNEFEKFGIKKRDPM